MRTSTPLSYRLYEFGLACCGRIHLWLHQFDADNIDVVVPAGRTVHAFLARMIGVP